MTNNSASMSFDLSLVYKSWTNFRRGKKASRSIIRFEANLLDHLYDLTDDLSTGNYRHGSYQYRQVYDPKQRTIAVAEVRDRVVHRLVYDAILPIIDRCLDYDVWSCRPGKGLHAAIKRTQFLFTRYQNSWVWRADIKKFFDNVDHATMMKIVKRYDFDHSINDLLYQILESYGGVSGKGIAIGNLTSQILANVYLNEFDRFVRHQLKPQGYVRYGDDFIMIFFNLDDAEQAADDSKEFLSVCLGLQVNNHNNFYFKVSQGAKFLGARIFAGGTSIVPKTWSRILARLTDENADSYHGLIQHISSRKQKNHFYFKNV